MPGRVMSRDALMDLTKGETLEAFDRSVDVHVSRIRAAIEDDPKKPRRIITVRGAGYVFAKEQDRAMQAGSTSQIYSRSSRSWLLVDRSRSAADVARFALRRSALRRHAQRSRASLRLNALPPPDAPRARQQEAIEQLHRRLRIDLALYAPRRRAARGRGPAAAAARTRRPSSVRLRGASRHLAAAAERRPLPRRRRCRAARGGPARGCSPRCGRSRSRSRSAPGR